MFTAHLSTDKEEVTLQGIAASPGVAHGLAHLFFYRELEIPVYSVEAEYSKAEVERLEDALATTRSQVVAVRTEVVRRLGEAEAKIFDAHLLVLEDRALIEETIEQQAESSYNIDYCFHNVAKRYIEAFDNINDEYIRERVVDIRDVTKRVLHNLLGHPSMGLLHLTEPRVLVSEDISPSDTAGLDRSNVLAIVTDTGSRTSHAVIMARSLKVPAVVGLHNISSKLRKDDMLLVDGYEGRVVLNPTQETLHRYRQLKIERDQVERMYEAVLPLPTETQDGHHIRLVANIEGLQDLPHLEGACLEGVGLFRTENLFLRSEEFPSEDAQVKIYKQVIEAVYPHSVVIRTVDLGGDKQLNWSRNGNENNPFMGFRAIRFCLEHTTLFKDQLRAILRASAFGRVKLMYPMISSVLEVNQANLLLEEVKMELRQQAIAFDEGMEVGCMIEIPSAALTVDLLSRVVRFFSIGTNDLIQYTLAVDRGNDKIAHLYEPHHPAVIRIVHHVLQESAKYGLPASICGEIAADPLYVPLLFGLGATELSIVPAATAHVRYLIRSITYAEARSLADSVLKLEDPVQILDTLQAFYQKKIASRL